MIRIVKHERGPRVYLVGLRVHHGTTGIVCMFVGRIMKYKLLHALGCALVLHDAKDFPFTDNNNH